MRATAWRSAGPARSTSIGSSLTSAQSRMCSAGATVGVGRELAVLDDRLLRLPGGQELHQPDRCVAVLGALDEPDAGEVGVRARAVLVGPGGRDGKVRVLGQLAAEVVVVREADVAAAGGDRVQDVDVRAQHARLVRHPRAQQPLRRGLAVLGDAVGDEGLVVLVVARAQAELGAEARVAEVLVARHGVGGDALRGAHRRADAGADAPPRALRVAQALVDVRAQRRGLDGLEQPGLLGAPEVREVRGHEQVGGRLGAFTAQPLEELGRGAAAQLDVQAGLLLEAP